MGVPSWGLVYRDGTLRLKRIMQEEVAGVGYLYCDCGMLSSS
jgi:hypothetical protein